MKHSLEELKNISLNTGNLVNTVNKTIDVLDMYEEDLSDISGTKRRELKRHRRILKRVKNAVVKKPSVALFGASQVGKSYLAENLLCDNDAELFITDAKNDSNQVNFLKEINPYGSGSEATALITRFTVLSQEDKAGYYGAIKMKCLSVKDIALILIDSFCLDVEKTVDNSNNNDAAGPELEYRSKIEEIIKNLPQYYKNTSQNDLTEDDIYEIEEYIKRKLGSRISESLLQALSDNNYWVQIASNIYKVQHTDWMYLLSVLWGNLRSYNEIFELLVENLKKMDFPEELYITTEMVKKSDGNILDISTLGNLFLSQNDNKKFPVISKENRRYEISAGLACAICYEVIFSVSEKSIQKNSFIKDLDFLDFPGARTRLKLNRNANLDIHKHEAFLRGKVAYLFNSYSSRYEANSLFACHKSDQTNVRDVPVFINDWINDNIGNTPAERQRTLEGSLIPPLFIVFTMWNKQLDYDSVNDLDFESYEKKWHHRFGKDKLFDQEIKGGFTWPDEWTEKGMLFRNYYLLRSYRYSSSLFDGWESNKQEVSVLANRNEYYQSLKMSFCQSSLVKSFFDDPELIWEKTSTLNNDGSAYIIENLLKTNIVETRTQRFLSLAKNSIQVVYSMLSKMRVGDKEKEMLQATKDAKEIHASMNVIFGKDAFQFGNFLAHLTVDEKDIYEFYHDALRELETVKAPELKQYQLLRAQSPKLSEKLTFEDNLRILMEDYKFDSQEETKNHFENELKVDLTILFYGKLFELKSNSEVLAEKAFNYWKTTKLDITQFNHFLSLGFRENHLQLIFKNLVEGFEKKGLINHIALNIRAYVDLMKRVDLAEDMIAHVTASIINEFVNSFGYNYLTQSELHIISEANKKNNLRLSFPNTQEVFAPMEKFNFEEGSFRSIEGMVDIMVNLNEHLNKIPLDLEVINLIPMVKNYHDWRDKMAILFVNNKEIPSYNIEANRKVGQLLEEVESNPLYKNI